METPQNPTLETERLRLRPPRGGDFEDYAALYADHEVVRLLGNGDSWDRGRSWRHLAFAIGHWQMEGFGPWLAEDKATGAFIGIIGFWQPVTWPGFELAWHLARRFWGRGYATEGARAALAQAFLGWKRQHVISLVNPANLPSIRVAERIGERLESHLDNHFGLPMLVYGLDRATYLRGTAQDTAATRRAG
jgi:RimJ/RimL family protein N-acetyltransferase